MGVAIWQALEAKKARKAAESQASSSERSAVAAEEQVVLARTEVERERLAREEQESAQARLILIDVRGFGGLGVEVANHSLLPVTKLEIEKVIYIEHPDLPWKVNRLVTGARAEHEQLVAGGSVTVPVVFTGADDSLVRGGNGTYEITISFNDASGKRWRRTGAGDPVRATEQPDVA